MGLDGPLIDGGVVGRSFELEWRVVARRLGKAYRIRVLTTGCDSKVH